MKRKIEIPNTLLPDGKQQASFAANEWVEAKLSEERMQATDAEREHRWTEQVACTRQGLMMNAMPMVGKHDQIQ